MPLLNGRYYLYFYCWARKLSRCDMKESATILVCLLLAIPVIAQENYFLDETDRRLPQETSVSARADVADIDRDGDLDIMGATWAAIPPYQPYYLFVNDGRGFFSQENEDRLPDTSFLSVDLGFGDIDGDNDYDAYIGSEHDQDLLFVNNGSGYFSDQTAERFPPLACGNVGFVFGDFSGDSYLDIITMCCYTYCLNHYLLNDGHRYFEDVTSERMPPDTLFDGIGVAEDIDNDLDLDLLLSWHESNGGPLGIRGLENEDGYFFPFGEGRLPGHWTRWIDAADIDGDGDLDVIVSSVIDLGILINYGGTLIDETDERLENLGPEYGGPTKMGLGDYDNDGDFDIFAGYSIEVPDHLFLNDGRGYFSLADERVPNTQASTRWVEPFDADGDGDLDLFLACSGDGVQRILINYSSPDTISPNFLALEGPEGIVDTAAQYSVRVSAYDNISVEKGALTAVLSYRVNGGTFDDIDFSHCGGTIFSAAIPSQPEGSFVEYYVALRDKMGNVSASPPGAPDSLYSFWVSFQTDVESENGTPVINGLNVYPNPFNNSVNISFELPCEGFVLIEIYDILGRKIKVLPSQYKNPGSHHAVWDGTNMAGESVDSGLYYLVLKQCSTTAVHPAVLVR
jgi:hypothetical protein